MRYLICLIPVLLSASVMAGSIHKWVDEDGNVHYGDAPPVSAKTESVSVQSAPSNPGRSLPRLSSPGESGGSAATDTAAGDAAGVPKDQAQVACDQARQDLKVIKSSSRVKLRSADGSTRYMTTEEIDQRKQQAEADVKQFCK